MAKKKDVASATKAEFDAALAGAKPVLRLERRAGARPEPGEEPPPHTDRDAPEGSARRTEPGALGLLSELWPDFAAELERRADGSFDPISTGLRDLDEAMGGGFPRGGITVLPAAPGTGKTTFMLWAGLARATEGTPVIFWSLELTAHDALARLVSILEGQPWGEVRRGKHPGPVKLAGEAAQGLPFAVHGVDTCPDVPTMLDLVERLTATYGKAPLLVIDYAQLLIDELAGEQRSSATAVSKDVAALAGRTGAAVVAISSVGRAAYNVMDRKGRPDIDRVLGMAKESGQFEYDAAAVLALVAVREEEPDRYTKLWAVLGKHRFGNPGRMVPLEYDGMSGKWTEISPEEMPARGATKASPEELREKIFDLVERRGGEYSSRNKLSADITGNRNEVMRMIKCMVNVGELQGGKTGFKKTGKNSPDKVLAMYRGAK